MGYIGTPIDTRNQFQSLQGKRFNGDGSTTDFTLDVAPGNVLDIEVFVGNVRQDPNSAYTVSGTTLSFTGAPPSGTNNIYVVHQAKSVGTIDVPALGVSTASIQADAITEAKIADDAVESEHLNDNIISGQTALGATPADTDEFLVSDAGTLKRVDYSYIKGETNTPMFAARRTTSQSISDNSYVKIQFATEDIDTDSAYDNSSNYRFTVPSGKAGKYLFSWSISVASQTGVSNAQQIFVALYKNGSKFIQTYHDARNNGYGDTFFGSSSFILDCSASDYFEVYTKYNDGGGSDGTVQSDAASFSGVRLLAS